MADLLRVTADFDGCRRLFLFNYSAFGDGWSVEYQWAKGQRRSTFDKRTYASEADARTAFDLATARILVGLEAFPP